MLCASHPYTLSLSPWRILSSNLLHLPTCPCVVRLHSQCVPDLTHACSTTSSENSAITHPLCRDYTTKKRYNKVDKNPYAVALGRLGGLKGGKARAARLSPERRTEIAKKAAQARWSK